MPLAGRLNALPFRSGQHSKCDSISFGRRGGGVNIPNLYKVPPPRRNGLNGGLSIRVGVVVTEEGGLGVAVCIGGGGEAQG